MGISAYADPRLVRKEKGVAVRLGPPAGETGQSGNSLNYFAAPGGCFKTLVPIKAYCSRFIFPSHDARKRESDSPRGVNIIFRPAKKKFKKDLNESVDELL
jgi:hypothetical protein